MDNEKTYREGLLQAYKIADMFADENMRMVVDTIKADPILNDDNRKKLKSCADVRAAAKLSYRLADDGLIYASRSNAARDIADAIMEQIEGADFEQDQESRKNFRRN